MFKSLPKIFSFSFFVRLIKWLLLGLLLVWALFYFSLSLVRGYWFAAHRPDRTDVAPYSTAAHILHTENRHKIYNYEIQKQIQNILFAPSKARLQQNKFPWFLNSNDKKFLQTAELQTSYYYYPPNSLLLPYLMGFFGTPQIYIIVNSLSLLLLLFTSLLSFKERSHNLVEFSEETFNNSSNNIFLFITLAVSVLLFLPLNRSLFHSQISLALPLFFYLYYFYLCKNKNLLAGIFLALTLIKPQFGIFCSLIALCQKSKKPFLYSLLITFLLCLFAYSLIGLSGFQDYWKSTVQLLALKNYHLFVPIPNQDIHPLKDWVVTLFSSSTQCNLSNAVKADLLVKVFCGVSFAAFLWVLQLKLPERLNFYKIALLLLLSKLAVSYHNTYDYCFWLVLLLFIVQANSKYSKVFMWLFIVLVSLLPHLMDTFLGAQFVVYKLHFHVYWLETLLLSIVMLFGLYSKRVLD